MMKRSECVYAAGLAWATLAAVGAAAAQPIIYVNAAATGANDGTTWTNAYTDLQDALAAATGAGREIWVAAGVYTPSTTDASVSFAMHTGVALYGGFAGNETTRDQRDWVANNTILSGDIGHDDEPGNINSANSGHVLISPDVDATAVLDGFTISDGHLGGSGGGSALWPGSGLYNVGGSPTITNCVFSNNITGSSAGGGIYNWNGSPTITNCRFTGNVSHLGDGAGLYNTGSSSPLIEDCVFLYNICISGGDIEALGAGLAHDAQTPLTVRRCLFEGNACIPFSVPSDTASWGGGLSNFSGNLTVTDCVFKNNSANYGGGLITWGPATVANSLFVDNHATITPADPYPEIGGFGAGLAVISFTPDLLTVRNTTIAYNHGKKYAGVVALWNGVLNVTDSIIWGNTGTDPDFVGRWSEQIGGFATLTYSCVPHIFEPGGPGEDPIPPQNLPGVIDADPQFIQPAANGDLHLAAPSPCINAGDPAFTPDPGETDFDGYPRVLCATVDMGIYEFGIGDYNCSRVVDLTDFAAWPACVTGPNNGPYAAACEAFDFDADGDVDMIDFLGFQRVAEGGSVGAPSSIGGHIAYADTTPLAGAEVSISGPLNGTVATDADGAYGFADLPAGTYTIVPTVATHYFYPYDAAVTVTEGDTITGVDFEAHDMPQGPADGEFMGTVTAVDLQAYSITMQNATATLTLFVYPNTIYAGDASSLDTIVVGWDIQAQYFLPINVAEQLDVQPPG